jgi:hypothetical protein
MKFYTKGNIWITLAGVFGFIYLLSAHSLFSDLARALGIEWLGEILTTLFMLMTICLFGFLYDNPTILFSTKAGKDRAFITTMFWHEIRKIPDEELEIFENRIKDVIDTM